MNLIETAKSMAVASAVAPKLEKLKKAAQDVEAVFLKDLIAEMQKGMKKTTFGDSTGSEIYQDMFNDTLAQAASKAGNFGIGKVLYRQFAKDVVRQEAARLKMAAMEATPSAGNPAKAKENA